jgi:parallel beta-helix repeat protein
MRTRISTFVALGFLWTFGTSICAEEKPAVVSVRDFAGKPSGTGGIQEAIDALPEKGGTVIIPAGRYVLRRSILPRSNVTLRGEGPVSVLVRPEEFQTPLAAKTVPNQDVVSIKETGSLKVGDQIIIRDRRCLGWHSRHGIIRSIEGKTLRLDLLHSAKNRVYSPAKRGRLSNWYPAIWLWDVHHVTIENLTIDGLIEKHPAPRSDFVVSAIHTRGSNDLRVMDVVVRNWPGDGISVQKGNGALVRGCLVENCRGNGLHPGSGLINSTWVENTARRNTRRGYFFCMHVRHAVVKDNLFLENGESGIGGLGDGGDRFNVVSGNVCAGNAWHGIEASGSVYNVVTGNICRNNGRKSTSRCAAIYLRKHKETIVKNNLCVDDQDKPTQTKGVVSLNPAGKNLIADNRVVVEKGPPQDDK